MTMQPDEFRRIRKELGLTQEEFAKRLGVSRKLVNALENSSEPIDTRTANAARYLTNPYVRVTVGSFGSKFVVVATEATPMLPGRVTRVLSPAYDDLDSAITAAESFSAEHGCPYISTSTDYARLLERRLEIGDRYGVS